MIAFSIDDTKQFFKAILKDTTFDKFEVRSIAVETFARFDIDGKLNKDFFHTEEPIKRNYCTWEEMKPFVFTVIKGNTKPSLIKIVFSLAQSEMEKVSPNAQALFFNITFEENKILCTTGTAEKSFSFDKQIDIDWEQYILDFLKKADFFVSTLL